MVYPLKICKGYKPSKGVGVNMRRVLTTSINCSDDGWEMQNIPADLAEAINLCKETKCTSLHTDPCPVLLHLLHFGAHWSHVLECFYCLDNSQLVSGNGFVHFLACGLTQWPFQAPPDIFSSQLVHSIL